MTEGDLTFRELRPEDASAVAELMSEHALWGDRTVEQGTRWIERLLGRGEYGLVAESTQGDGRMVAGFAVLCDGTFGDHGYIRLFGTRQGFTGRGIGARLLAEAERVFVTRRMDRVFLLCTDWNAGAQTFYERHGYVRVGLLPDWLAPGVGELIYVKRDLAVR